MRVKPISQREARRLRTEVKRLQELLLRQRNQWAYEFPEGTWLLSVTLTEAQAATLKTARKLSHAVVVTMPNQNTADFFGMPL